MIQPINHQTLPDVCAARLRQMILAGEFSPGERLPPERALAERFDVNRVTLRNALARLAASGLVEVRQGRGYTVLDYRSAGGPDLLPGLADLARTTGDLLAVASDLLLVRRNFAVAVFQHIAAQPPEDISAVEEAVAAFTSAVNAGAGPDVLGAADADILEAILAVTDSAVLQICMNPIRDVLTRLSELTAVMYRDPGGNVLGWQVALSWLAAPDPGSIGVISDLLTARDTATIAALKNSLSASEAP